MPYLAFNLNDGNEFVFDLLEDKLSIGRDSRNDIVIDNGYISGFHAEFLRQPDGAYEIVDLNSSNGIFINGKRVERSRVKGGDRVQFGQLEAKFRDRAPKGLAPADAKTSSPGGKGSPSRTDGRRGDTESVPLGGGALKANRTADLQVAKSPVEAEKKEATRATSRVPSSDVQRTTSKVPQQIVPKPSSSPVPVQEQGIASDLATTSKVIVPNVRSLATVVEPSVAKAAEAELAALNVQAESRRKEIATLNANLASLTQQSIALQKVNAEAKATQEQVEKARAELEHIRATISAESASAAKLAAAGKVQAEAKVTADEQRNSSKLAELRKQVSDAQTQLATVATELEENQKQAIHAAKEAEATKALATQQAESIKQAEAKLASLKEASEAAEAALAKVNAQTEAQAAEAARLAIAKASVGDTSAALTELQTKHLALDVAVAALAATHSEKQSALAAIESAASAHQAKADEAIKAKLTAEASHAELTRAIDAQTQRLSESIYAADAAAEKAKELETQTNKLKASEEALAIAQAKLADETARVEALRAEFKELEHQRTIKQADFDGHSTRLTSEIQGREASLQALLSRESDLTQKLSELASTDTRLGDATQALKAVEEQRDLVETQRATLVAGLASLTSQRDEQTTQLTRLTEQGRAQHLLVQTLSKQHSTLEKSVSDVEVLLKEATEKNEAKTRELRETEEALASKMSALAEAESKLGSLGDQITSLTTQHQSAASAFAELHERTTARQSEHDSLATSLSEKSQQLAETHQSLEKAHQQHTDISSKATAIESVILALTTAEVGHRAQHDTAKNELTALQATLGSVQAEHATESEKLSALKSQQAALASEANAQLQTQQKTLAELVQQQDKLRKDIAELEQAQKAEKAKSEDFAKKAKAEETRVADAEKRVAKASATLEQLEAKRRVAEDAITHASSEEKRLRKELPGVSAEMLTVAAALATNIAKRDETDQSVRKLSAENELAIRRSKELEVQLTNLDEGIRVREERLNKVQADVDREAQRLKVAQDAARKAEVSVADLLTHTSDQKKSILALEAELSKSEATLSARVKHVETLAAEEQRLVPTLSELQAKIEAANQLHKDLHSKVSETEDKLSTLTQKGGKALNLDQLVVELEQRHQASAQALREASEQELTVRAQINTVQEALNRENQRLETIKKEAAQAEAEQLARIQQLQQQSDHAKAGAEAAHMQLGQLSEKLAEMAKAETDAKHWQQVEQRLRGQLIELEEKHEIMRRGLASDESTVVMFASDLIKRIDLIDILIQRFAGQNGSAIEGQLRTLRASFEDILHQHGVTEFIVDSGTEIDVKLRQRLNIIEALPGPSKPKVIESYRPGFIYSRDDGREVVLRKVEVKTSSV